MYCITETALEMLLLIISPHSEPKRENEPDGSKSSKRRTSWYYHTEQKIVFITSLQKKDRSLNKDLLLRNQN